MVRGRGRGQQNTNETALKGFALPALSLTDTHRHPPPMLFPRILLYTSFPPCFGPPFPFPNNVFPPSPSPLFSVSLSSSLSSLSSLSPPNQSPFSFLLRISLHIHYPTPLVLIIRHYITTETSYASYNANQNQNQDQNHTYIHAPHTHTQTTNPRSFPKKQINQQQQKPFSKMVASTPRTALLFAAAAFAALAGVNAQSSIPVVSVVSV